MKKNALELATILSVGMLAGCGAANGALAATETPAADKETTAAVTEVVEVAEAAAEGIVTEAAALTEEVKAENDIVFMGGLYAVSETCDMNLALFKSAGEPVAIVEIPCEGILYYGEYTTEAAKTEDGTEYTLITVEDHQFGYYFDDEYTGILVDEDGNVYNAKSMDESFAMDMVAATLYGSNDEDVMPSAEEMVAAVLADLVYEGGLVAEGDESDLAVAFYRYQDDPLTLVYENGTIVEYGYNYNVTDATLEDGTKYSDMTIGAVECGYYFFEDGSGIVVDADGNKYDAVAMDEDKAIELVTRTITGE